MASPAWLRPVCGRTPLAADCNAARVAPLSWAEPLLSALVTAGDRQMHPRFPAVAEQLGWTTPAGTRPHTAWSYEVLKAHQHWRHRR
ncbi:hypothetical protein [Streptomyces sp. NPDC001717]|uniref:hypothetical protein n=1 Tax=Streptomyces sp. NPDC001717 TaxID=3364604 RepID=UPI0036B0B58F